VSTELFGAGDAGAVPSRVVLDRAERVNDAAGHELAGFLSTSAGFMPKLPVKLAFPPSHAAWDEAIRRMPSLWRTVALRGALDELPVLSGAREDLPDEYVWRASVALSHLAHAYVRVEVRPPEGLPAGLSQPWAQISERLGRREPHLSYNDLIVYNFRFLDPDLPAPYTVENMERLVPTVDNREERRFYAAQTEILARSTPAVGAAVRAQEAAVRGDHEALRAELTLMLETWRDITEISFRKVDPNPLSRTYIDQVVWSNTVAPFAVPIKTGTAAPGGEASPIFHLMDAFLGRKFKQSHLAQEVVHLLGWVPEHHIAFIQAIERVSVRDHIASSGDRQLQNLFDTLFDAYAGEKGYLGTHRLKVYGFLELAFKVGRTVSLTGIAGGFRERQWKALDGILEETRLERFKELPPHTQYARVTSREPASPSGDVTHLVMDTSETGVIYRPGDRCGVLPDNRPEIVEALLRVFRASGDEPVALTVAWRESVRYRREVPDGADTLPLRSFLTYAKVRPLTRRIAKSLLAVSATPGLRDIIEQHGEEHWELSDALELMARGGYEVRRLLAAELWQQEALARIVPPEDFRMYSVASAPADGPESIAGEFDLTTVQLRYPADESVARMSGTELVGTASTFLGGASGTEARAHPFAVKMIRPSRFCLPRDGSRPIVMFAGGVGIAPFLGFLAERRRAAASGDSWLFLGTRSRGQVYAETALADALDDGKLAVRVAFSREEGALQAGFGEQLRFVPGPAQRIDQAILRDDELQRTLWDLLRSEEEGGRGASIYVCGRAAFAQSVMSALTGVAERFVDGPEESRSEQARVAIRRLFAEGRYMQDVFTSWAAHTDPGVLGDAVFDTSEVVLHTTPESGQWTVIDGSVYDMTEFLHLHPGGPRIITENVGLDATVEYEAVLHHENSEIDAMLAMYKIGTIRRLEFGDAWGVALVPGEGLAVVTLHDLYRHWARFMHLLTEMSNALANDWGYMSGALTRGDDPEALNALKVQYASNTHRRYMSQYYETALGDDLRRLWALTTGLCAAPDFSRSLMSAIDEASASEHAEVARRFTEHMRTLYLDVAGDPAEVDDALWERLRTLCASVEAHDLSFLHQMRSIIRSGIMVFEELERDTVGRGGEKLVAVLDQVPVLVRAHQEAFVERLAAIGCLPPSGD
jgi:sulfite reductase (NADPH) flavoprotein alpha-component